MSSDNSQFSGFSTETFNFFAELSENNTLAWFNQNRERYNTFVVDIAKSLINSLAPFFNQIEPAINTEPKFDKTMLRINLDARFTAGNNYRNYFLIHFRRFKKDSEFFIYIDKKGIEYGLMVNNALGRELFFNKNLPGHKDELVDTFKKFDLNKKFDFYEMKKTPELIFRNFDIENDFDRMARTKFFLLQKEISRENEILYSTEILIELIKTFSQLYMIYCFCISHNPIALIEEFEETLEVLK